MKRNILVFGGIAGLILAVLTIVITTLCANNPNYDANEVVTYSGMIVAFSFIYVGIRNYRDRHQDGVIGFGKALRIGLGITLIASSFYVLAWLIEYYFFIPDFMDKYAAHMIREARNNGLTGAALDKRVADLNQMGKWYKNPLIVILFTYLEVVPVGIVISLIAALIVRRKTQNK
jgi:amino acid transporter